MQVWEGRVCRCGRDECAGVGGRECAGVGGRECAGVGGRECAGVGGKSVQVWDSLVPRPHPLTRKGVW